jgi:hypothetical protein
MPLEGKTYIFGLQASTLVSMKTKNSYSKIFFVTLIFYRENKYFKDILDKIFI